MYVVLKRMWGFPGEKERKAYSQQNNDSNHSRTLKHERAEVKVHVRGGDVGTVDFQPHG